MPKRLIQELIFILDTKLTSAQISNISFKKASEVVIVAKVSLMLRLQEKKFWQPNFLRAISEKIFHFPLLLLSKYFLIHVVLRDLLKEIRSIIFRPP